MNLKPLLPESIKSRLRPYWLALNHYWRTLLEFANWLKLQSKITPVKFKRLFAAAAIPAEAEGRLNLHLGCGKIDHKKFINIDGYPFPHVHYVQAIDKLPQFKDDTVDLIYASHCLEHFNYSQTETILKEWCRVLKKGAILRLSVPDFDKLVDMYLLHNRDPDVILEQLMGGQNNQYNFHLTALNKMNLSRLLIAAGFLDIEEWKPGTDDLTTFKDFSVYKKESRGRQYEISLNIQARKA